MKTLTPPLNTNMRIFAKKSLGQNFLSNPKILEKIAAAAELTKKDIVLEIGPGTGNLTKILAERASRVIAVEKDSRLIPLLKSDFSGFDNVEIIEGDVLELDMTKMPFVIQKASLSYKIVGNIPYYITSHLLRTIFESANWRLARPKLIVLTIQKEVAQRIVAKPPKMSILAVSAQFYADAKIIDYVSKGSFRPSPKVDSAIISLKPKNLKSKPEEITNLFQIVRLGFSSKRKKLVSNLAGKFDKRLLEKIFIEIGLGPNIRAEELSVEIWLKLAKKLL